MMWASTEGPEYNSGKILLNIVSRNNSQFLYPSANEFEDDTQ